MNNNSLFTHPVTFTSIELNRGNSSTEEFTTGYTMDADDLMSTDFFEDEIANSKEKVDARCSYWQYDVTGGESEPATDEQLEYIKQHWDELDSTTLTLLETSRVFLEPEDYCEESGDAMDYEQ